MHHDHPHAYACLIVCACRHALTHTHTHTHTHIHARTHARTHEHRRSHARPHAHTLVASGAEGRKPQLCFNSYSQYDSSQYLFDYNYIFFVSPTVVTLIPAEKMGTKFSEYFQTMKHLFSQRSFLSHSETALCIVDIQCHFLGVELSKLSVLQDPKAYMVKINAYLLGHKHTICKFSG